MNVACVLLIAPRLCMLPSKAECIDITPKRPSCSAVSFFLYFIFIFSSFFNHIEGGSLLFAYSRLSNASLWPSLLS